MADFLLDMEWKFCIDGYRTEPDPQGGKGALRLIRKSAYFRYYKPFQKYEMLYSAFARVGNEADLLKFVHRYGSLLSSDQLRVPDHLYDAQTFRELIVAGQKSMKSVAETFDRRAAEKEIAWYKKNHPSVEVDLTRVIEAGPEIWIGMTKLVSDSTNGIRLFIDPYSLMDGLWIQMMRKLSKKLIRTCRYCESTFEVGPGSRRRADATFCCSEHSIRFHSFRRSKGE
jgi:hypothetical protein